MTNRPHLQILVAALGCWLVCAAVLLIGIHWSKPLVAVALVLVAVAVPSGAVVIIARRRGRRMDYTALSATLLCAIFASASAGLAVDSVATGPLVRAATNTNVVIAELTINSDPRIVATVKPLAAPRLVVDVRVSAIRVHHRLWRCSTPAQLLLRPEWSQQIELGARMTVIARAAPARAGAKSAAYLTALEPPQVSAAAPLWARIANAWRAGLRAASRSDNLDATGLFPALAIGDSSATPVDLVDDMRISGLSHLSAVSGANVSIVLVAVVLLGLMLRIRGRLLAMLAGAVLAWFVVLARPSPSVVRAAVMGGIGLIPLIAGWRRKQGGINGLLALSLSTCLLMVLDPWLAISWGFALSFFATLGLISGSHAVSSWLEQHTASLAQGTSHGRHTRPTRDKESTTSRWAGAALRLRVWFIGALSVTLCAQIAVAPVLLAMGASMSWVAVPANLLAEPVVAPATVSGLVSAALSPISPPLAHFAAQPGLWATRWIAAVAHKSANIAKQYPIAFNPTHLLHATINADTIAVLCDVGQGTAFALRLAPHSAIVIDVGPAPAPVDKCLQQMGITDIPLLVLSHFHADHIGGLSGALRGRRVGMVVVSPLAQPQHGVHMVTQTLSGAGLNARVASAGERLTVGSALIQVLTPAQLLSDIDSPPNDNCLALSITETVPWRAAPIRALAPCDLEYAGQEELLQANAGLPGNFDITVVPHHGSSKQLEEFAHWAHPRIALIPVGRHNDYGHPAAPALLLWSDAGFTELGRTDLNGNLVIGHCGTTVCLRR